MRFFSSSPLSGTTTTTTVALSLVATLLSHGSTVSAKPISPLMAMDWISETAERDEEPVRTSNAAVAQMDRDFPDPSIVQDGPGGDWYAFATNGNGKNVQMARAPDPLGPWEWINEDAMPDRSWTTGRHTWAPDVRRLGDGSYVLYFSGQLPDSNGKHCIGIALSDNVEGPYEPLDGPWVCALGGGGAIDPAGFFDDDTGRRYVSYKVDGNHIGNGGDCGNSVEPLVSTPLMLQEVDPEDGYTKMGDPVQIWDREGEDGPLVEAPDIVRLEGGTYILFFSSQCYAASNYNVNYATSSEGPHGPYTRAERPLLITGDFGLDGPGGATSIEGGGAIVFHARCDDGRCLHASEFIVRGRDGIA